MPRNAEVSMSPATARRVLNAVRAFEGAPIATGPRSEVRLQSSNWFAKVTTAIGAGNMAATPPTLGTGKVTLLYVDNSATPPTLLEVPGQTDVDVVNGGASVASGRVIQVKFASGALVADVDYC